MQLRIDDLNRYFLEGAKPSSEWTVGTETEKFALHRDSGHAVLYHGQRSVVAVLNALESRHGWEATREQGQTTALTRGESRITLEPGGQVELSGRKCKHLQCTEQELHQHVQELVELDDELGVFWLGLGVQPISLLSSMAWVPKARYGIMGPYMATRGTESHRMMQQTAAVQISVDYADGDDAIAKLRRGLMLAPVLTAMYANSPWMDGQATGWMSTRARIWQHTDSDRSGLLPAVFQPGFSIRDYVEAVLDVPMLFLVRDGQWLDATGRTFRMFVKDGFEQYSATLDDWELHLSTLFTETRLKRYVEVRSTDCQRHDLLMSVPAVLKGLMYHPQADQHLVPLLGQCTSTERQLWWESAARDGLQARWGKHVARDIAQEVISIAREGLSELVAQGLAEEGDDVFLEPLREQIEVAGVSPAEALLREWETVWQKHLLEGVRTLAYPSLTPAS